MNKLQKRAWINLGCMAGALLFTVIFLSFAVHVNMEVDVLGSTLSFLVGLTAGVIVAIRILPKENLLDEREKLIAHTAFTYSSYVFIFFMVFTSQGIFFFSSARDKIPVYLPFLLSVSGLFISQLVSFSIVQIWCVKEQQNG
ncbi:MAG: hypothetical protein JXA96_17090 [Sedimentisphaerales bacterium]|nr:hypothetical protein [Sedimentisphaerales bacterium]